MFQLPGMWLSTAGPPLKTFRPEGDNSTQLCKQNMKDTGKMSRKEQYSEGRRAEVHMPSMAHPQHSPQMKTNNKNPKLKQ